MKEDLFHRMPPIPVDALTIHEEVGRGARSVVYRASYEAQEFAIKFFHGATITDDSVRMFRREAAIHASLRHPAVPAIFDVGEHQGRPYILSELIRGETLAECLSRGPLTIAVTIRLASTLASVLHLVHRNGLVHRDIKPRNILASQTQQFKLIDFGLAAHGAADPNGSAVGTFRYSAPEQTGMLERPVDDRADLYGLGVVLFECLVGAPPFDADDIGELLHQHAAIRPPDVASLRPDCPAALSRLVAQLLEKDPDERPASAAALLSTLNGMLPSLAHDIVPVGVLAPDRPDPEPPEHLQFETLTHSSGDRGARGLFVGRDVEQRHLELVLSALTSKQGSTLLVSGASGSGKTRLLELVLDRAAANGISILKACCRTSDPYPLAPLRQALESSLVELSHGLKSSTSAANPSGPPERNRSTALELTELLQLNPPDANQTAAPEQFFDALCDYILNLATQQGRMVLWIDDIQWLDQTTFDALGVLANRLQQSPLLLILSTRNEELYQGTLRQLERQLVGSNLTRMELKPLAPLQIQAMLRELMGAPLPADFVSQIADLSQGNPLAIWQYLLTLRDGGALLPHWGQWVIDERLRADLPFPDDLCALVVSRARQLTQGAKEVLSIGAMLGLQFDPESLLPILGAGSYREIQQALSEGLEAHLIERGPHSSQLVFVHDKVRETLFQYLPFSEDIFHRRAADYLDQKPSIEGRLLFERAHHYIRGYGQTRPLQTFQACLDGATQAVSDHAYPHAWELLTFAGTLGILSDVSPALQLAYHRARGTAAFNTDRIDEAITQLQLAVQLTSDPIERAFLREQLIRAAVYTFNTRVGTEEMEQAFHELGLFLPSAHIKQPDQLQAHLLGLMKANDERMASAEGYGSATEAEREKYRVLIRLCDSGFLIGYYTRNMPFAMQCGALSVIPAFLLGDTLESCQGYATYAFMLGLLGQKGPVTQYVERTLTLARRLGTPQAMAIALCQSGLAHHLVGNSELALTLQREAFEHYARWLSPILYQNCVVDLAWNTYIRGYTEEELMVSQTALQRLQHQRGTFMAGYVCRASAAAMSAAASQGQNRLAAQYLREVEELRQVIPPDRPVPWVSVAGFKVSYLLQLSDLGADFEEAVAQHRSWNIPPQRSTLHSKHFYVAHAYARLMRVRRARTEQQLEAMDALRAAVLDLEATSSTETLKAHAWVLKANVLWLDGDWQGAWQLLDQARLLASEVDNPWAMFEDALTRALMLRYRGFGKAAALEAQRARQLAINNHWPQRQQQVLNQFQTELSSSTQLMEANRPHTQTSVIGGKLSQLQRQLDALLSLSRASAAVLDPDALARIALDESARILGAERAFLFVVNPLDQDLEFQCGRNAAQADLEEPTSYSRTVLQRVMTSGRPVVLSTRSDAAALESESVVAHDLRSVLAAPLHVGDRIQGVIYLDNRLARGFFSQDHAELLRAMGGYIATALQTARSARLEGQLQVEQERRRLAETLRELQTSLTSTLNLNEGLARLLHAMSRELNFEQSFVMLRSESKLECCVSTGFPGDELPPFYLQMPTLQIEGDRLQVRVLTAHEAHPEGRLTGLMLPLQSRAQTIGMVVILRPTSRPFLAHDLELATTLIAQAGIAIENARLFTRVKTLAERDGLTGLYNRREFFRQAEQLFHQSAMEETALSAIMFDVDHFKRFNDVYGHAVGDQVLKLVAQVTSESVRRSDVVGRYGGEEFAVLLPNASPRVAMDVAERIRGSIEARYLGHPGVGNLSVTVSVGIAYRVIQDDLNTLLSRADRALYASKRHGRNKVSYVTSDEDQASQH